MIGCIIQARMSSSRLPGKVLMKIDQEKPLILYVIDQLRYSKFVDKIVIATSVRDEDDVIVDFARKNNIKFFRGSLNDVLDRYYQCAKKFSFSSIVRITADNPLIDPSIVDDTIIQFNKKNFDYATNVIPRTFPHGTETEVFSFFALEKAWKEAKLYSEREHVTPYFYNNPSKFKILKIKYKENISHLRWTIDRKEDIDFVKKVISKLKRRPILMDDILNVLEKNPELIKINENYIKNEGYEKSLKEDKEFVDKE